VPYARRTAVATAARDFPSGGAYSALAYSRPAIVLRTLDRVHQGGVRRALQTYSRRHRFSHPTPDDLVAAVREETGDDAASTLRTALFDRGWIDVSVEDVTWRALGEGDVEVAVHVARDGTLALPVAIDVLDAEGGTTRLAWDGAEKRATVTARLPAAPTFVVLDPERALLLDDDLLDGVWAARPQPLVAGRTLGASSFVVRAALAALGP
jgi:aminopeptidase N